MSPIHRQTWRKKFFVNDFLTVRECDEPNFVILRVMECLASVTSCVRFLLGGNILFHLLLQFTHARNDPNPEMKEALAKLSVCEPSLHP
jgi:hypothetical protein